MRQTPALTKATALRVKSPHPGCARHSGCFTPPSGGSNRIRVKQHANLSPEQIEQHGYPFDILHALEQPDAVGKRTVKETDLVPRRKARSRGKTNEPAFILAIAQRINHTVRNRRRFFAIANEMADADRRTDATPALRLPIDRNEEIAREITAPEPSRRAEHDAAS